MCLFFFFRGSGRVVLDCLTKGEVRSEKSRGSALLNGDIKVLSPEIQKTQETPR